MSSSSEVAIAGAQRFVVAWLLVGSFGRLVLRFWRNWQTYALGVLKLHSPTALAERVKLSGDNRGDP
jgi:hypothetical protein